MSDSELAQAIHLPPSEWLRSRRRGLTNAQLTDAVVHLLSGEPAEDPAPDLFDTDPVRFPEPGEKMAPPELVGLMLEGESIGQAKQRLYPLLKNELDALKNQEALFGKTIPRRAEVEMLISILARVGEM